MPNVHTTLRGLFSDIADAIRAKTGGTEDIVADSFPTAISAIPTGRQPILQELTVTENRIYTPPQGTDGFSRVVVNQMDAMPDNIVTGKTILGVVGTAKTLRVETGTITPAEITNDIQIDCTPGYSLFVLLLSSGSPTIGNNQITQIYCTPEISSVADVTRNTNVRYINNSGENGYGIANAACDDGFALNTNIYISAGCTYTWTAYYWEDDA